MYKIFKFFLLTFISILFSQISISKEKLANNPEIKTFIQQMSEKHGFKQDKLISIFNQVHLRKTVIHHIKHPFEKKPWYLYRLLFVTHARIDDGIKFWSKNQKILEKAQKIYGVSPSIIVATIGIESKYGRNPGNYKVINALSSVAFSKSRRASFFKRELEEYLLLAREHNFDPLKMKGSYAGAMGLAQFMPDSYRRYAVSYNDHKKPDLYNNYGDIIMSIANYYHAHGWKKNTVIAKSTKPLINSKHSHKKIEKHSRFLKLENYFTHEYWLAFHNFEVIKKYNTSDLYAMAVYRLSKKITEGKIKADALSTKKNHRSH